MRIALVADFHGNWPATQALAQDLEAQQADQIICLGDMVGKGPSSHLTFDWAMAHCQVVIGGNWDYGVGEKRFPMDEYYWRQLGEERLAALRALPREHRLTLSGRRVRLIHGRPVMPELVPLNGDSQALQPYFEDGEGGRFDLVAYGDAHRQGLRTLTPGMLANCGSVGNALGEPYCCYALLEGDAQGEGPLEVRFRQVPYDRQQALADAGAAQGLPRVESYLLELKTGIYSR